MYFIDIYFDGLWETMKLRNLNPELKLNPELPKKKL